MGRYWAMDRDHRWDRTAKAYVALTQGVGSLVKTPEEAIDASYENGKTDEFIDPALICDKDGKPVSIISDNDAVIFSILELIDQDNYHVHLFLKTLTKLRQLSHLTLFSKI